MTMKMQQEIKALASNYLFVNFFSECEMFVISEGFSYVFPR